MHCDVKVVHRPPTKQRVGPSRSHRRSTHAPRVHWQTSPFAHPRPDDNPSRSRTLIACAKRQCREERPTLLRCRRSEPFLFESTPYCSPSPSQLDLLRLRICVEAPFMLEQPLLAFDSTTVARE